MAAEDDSPIRKDRDPILTIGFIVLVLAFATVGGVFVNDNYLTSDKVSPAVTGDSVNADYIGSYYGFHTSDGSVVFDTSFWKIVSDPAVVKSHDFTDRGESSYTPLSFTVGGTGNYLPAFMTAVYGLKPGESGRVCIAPADGYGALTADDVIAVDLEDIEVPRVQTMASSDFTSAYGSNTNLNAEILSPYGWMIRIISTDAGNVTFEHMVENGGIYRMNKDVNVKVELVGNTVKIAYKIKGNQGKIGLEAVVHDVSIPTTDGSDPTKFDSSILPEDYRTAEFVNVKLVKVFYEGKSYYITATDNAEEPTVYIMKNTQEKVGMYLYFEVTRV